MPASKKVVVVLCASACANAFFDFDVEPTCVPNKDTSDELFEMLLPHLCKFDVDAEYDPGFDCTDLPEECKEHVRQKALWASTKMYALSQGTDRPGCNNHAHLSREIEYPECVFGEPVPELRIEDMFTPGYNAREFAEMILSGNPTNCAANRAMKAYDVYGRIAKLRFSEVARHGRRENDDLVLQKIVDEVDVTTYDCKEPWKPETPEETAIRLDFNEWNFSRKVFNTEECTVIRHYNGSGFAKEHGGSLAGCKAECDLEASCNAFNMDLRFGITLKQAFCDLLNCPPDASKMEMFGSVAYARVQQNEGDSFVDDDVVVDVEAPSDDGPATIDTNNCDECGTDAECCSEMPEECAMSTKLGTCVERDDCSSGRRIGAFRVGPCGMRCCMRKAGCKFSRTERVCKMG